MSVHRTSLGLTPVSPLYQLTNQTRAETGTAAKTLSGAMTVLLVEQGLRAGNAFTVSLREYAERAVNVFGRRPVAQGQPDRAERDFRRRSHREQRRGGGVLTRMARRPG